MSEISPWKGKVDCKSHSAFLALTNSSLSLSLKMKTWLSRRQDFEKNGPIYSYERYQSASNSEGNVERGNSLQPDVTARQESEPHLPRAPALTLSLGTKKGQRRYALQTIIWFRFNWILMQERACDQISLERLIFFLQTCKVSVWKNSPPCWTAPTSVWRSCSSRVGTEFRSQCGQPLGVFYP